MPRKPLPSIISCSHCNSFETSKAGFTKNKKQRFYCRACRRFFRENPARKKLVKVLSVGNLPSAGNLILKLIALAQNLGRTPTTSDIMEFSKKGRISSLDVYYAIFGNFNNALRRAKLPLNYNQEFDKEKLAGELRVLRAKLKRPLFGKDVLAARKKGEVSSLYHFQRAFGSVPLAVAAAGAGKKKYTRDEMIKILRQLDADLNRPLLAADIDKLYRSGKGPSKRAVEKEFGGIAKARLAAKVKNSYVKKNSITRQWQKYTAEELVEQLKSLAAHIGKKPNYREINKASKEGKCAAATTFARKFGSLLKAYRAAEFS